MNKKTIVTILIEQHRILQKGLNAVAELLKSESIGTEEIEISLRQFKQDLVEHLELENGTFYPELLTEMKAEGQSVEKTEQFINEMKDIGSRVMEFLEKYKDSENIKKNIKKFRIEFPKISETLNIRIESEEATVYGYWGLF